MAMNPGSVPGVPRGGILGLVAAIPQVISAIKVAKQQKQLQDMAAGQQQMDIYRNIIKANPEEARNPDILAAITKIGRQSGNPVPMLQQQTAQQGPQGAGPGMTLPQQPPGRQTQQPTGPQLDVNAFLGSNPFADFVQKNLGTLEESDPSKRGAVATAAMGRPVTPQEDSQLQALPQQLPPAQQEQERKAIDTVVGKRLDEAAKTGTASALTAAVKFNYGRMERANYTDDEINALLDPALDKMTPVELQKIADGKATAGLKDAQAKFLTDSAKAKIDLIYQQADEDKARAAEIKQQGESIAALIAPKSRLMAAQAKEAYARAAAAGGINNSAVRRNNAEASYYSARALDLKTQGDPRAVTAALTSVRAAKASTDAGIRSIQGDITRIQTSLTSMSPTTKAANEPILAGLRTQMQQLQDRSNQYDSAITTLTNKVAPGALAPAAANPTPGYGIDGTATPPASGSAPAAAAPAQPPAGSQRVQNPSTGQYGWRYPDGTIHPDGQ